MHFFSELRYSLYKNPSRISSSSCIETAGELFCKIRVEGWDLEFLMWNISTDYEYNWNKKTKNKLILFHQFKKKIFFANKYFLDWTENVCQYYISTILLKNKLGKYSIWKNWILIEQCWARRGLFHFFKFFSNESKMTHIGTSLVIHN